MNAWLEAYLKWLRENKQANEERHAANNHGCWFDVQEVSLLLYLGKADDARTVCDKFKRRIDSQILPDGKMPRELARADGWGYSIFNVRAMMAVAELANHAGVDLWRYESPNGGSIRKAVDYLAPYADPAKKWPGKQLNAFTPADLVPILLQAQAVYGPDPYTKELAFLPKGLVAQDRMNLFTIRP
jgi:hypothetical protein